MPLYSGTSADVGSAVHCPRVNLAEASKLPSQDVGSPAWPSRSRKQQLDGLLFSPRALCTSPDDFTDMVSFAKGSDCAGGTHLFAVPLSYLVQMLQVQPPHGTDASRGRSRQLAPGRAADQQMLAVSAKAGHVAVSLRVVL